MVRSLLVIALIPLFSVTVALGEPTPTPTPNPSPTEASKEDGHGKKDRGSRDKDQDHRKSDDNDRDDSLARFKKRLEQMTPEERQHFQDNWKRWKQMGAGEQKDWQGRAMEERERVKKVIDDTIQKLGLKLDGDQREVFVLRYRQERRKIEEQLCKEIDAKRESEINDMLQRLKAEFSMPKPTPAPAAAGSPATP